jgi:hypothetical protein
MGRRRERVLANNQQGENIMAKTDKNKVTRQNRLRKVLSGMGKHLQNVPGLTIAQVVHQVAELQARIQKDIDLSDATDQSKAAWLTEVQKERSSHKDIDPLLRGIKQYVLLTWGDAKDASSTLEDFGYAPRKPMTTKPSTKVTAAAKAKATRTARHTMGPKAKLKVKGNVPAPTPSNGAASSTVPATPVAPAANPPATTQPR